MQINKCILDQRPAIEFKTNSTCWFDEKFNLHLGRRSISENNLFCNHHNMLRQILNKKSCLSPKTTAGWKVMPYRSKITLNHNPRKSVMYYEFSKEVFFDQQLFFQEQKKMSKEQFLFSFLCIVKQKKKNRSDPKNFEKFWFLKIIK